MAVVQDLQQLNVEILPVLRATDCAHDNDPSAGPDKECFAGNPFTGGAEDDQDSKPQLGNDVQQQTVLADPSGYSYKVKSRQCCLWSSKAALFVLFLNLIISVGLVSFLDPSFYSKMFSVHLLEPSIIPSINQTSYFFSTFFLLFYPLAGCLADIRCGRHKIIVNSLGFIFKSFIIMIFLGALAIIGFIPYMVYNTYINDTVLQTVTTAVLCVAFGLPGFFGAILVISSLVAFSANVIQYGLDQLHGSSHDATAIFIYWYVWTTFLGSLILRIPLVLAFSSQFLFENITLMYYPLTVIFALFFLGVAMCIISRKHTILHKAPAFRNPYKLVYKVFKYAKQHRRNPNRRSSFTDSVDYYRPSRIDLGKEKYGGPFSNEVVENAKAFVGIICVMLTVGPTFAADIAFNQILPDLAQNVLILSHYENNGTGYNDINIPGSALYTTGCLTPLMVVIIIPLYLCLVRPFVHDYVPGLFKRMGVGMILLLLSGLCTLVMGLFGHVDKCSLSDSDYNYNYYWWKRSCFYWISSFVIVSPHFLVIQSSLNAVGYILLYVASYEFICTQSPESMKGFLIGTFFAIKGVFQLFGVQVIYMPMITLCEYQETFPVCGFIYYLINIVMALAGIILFTCVARKYKYRQSNEYFLNGEENLDNTENEPDDNINE